MAKASKTQASQPAASAAVVAPGVGKTVDKAAVEDERQYSVRLTRSIKIGTQVINPRSQLVLLKGKVVKQHADAVSLVQEYD
jgi:hypothetical protein